MFEDFNIFYEPFNIFLKASIRFSRISFQMCVYEKKCAAGYPIFQKNGVPCGSKMLIYAQKGIKSRKIPHLETKKGYPEEERHRYTHILKIPTNNRRY